VKVTVVPLIEYCVLKADPKKAATCVAAPAVLSGEPVKPAAGEQVMRPRQGNTLCPTPAALAL
jgi:hypothetical protein